MTIRNIRLWLAQRIAPAGADVHDPDDTVCPSLQALLSAILYHQLTYADDEMWLLDVSADLYDLEARGLVEGFKGDWCLTGDGEIALARLWGPDRVPPWGGTLGICQVHGDYDVVPGDRIGCPKHRQDALELSIMLGHAPG